MFAKILYFYFFTLAALHGKAMNLIRWALNGSGKDVIDDVVRCATVDCATNALGCSEDFSHGSRQLTGH